MASLNGIKVRVSANIRPVPVLQISPSFEWCTDAYRAKHNAWMLERFGTYEPAYMLFGGELAVTQATLDKMTQKLEPYQENFLKRNNL